MEIDNDNNNNKNNDKITIIMIIIKSNMYKNRYANENKIYKPFVDSTC